MPANRHGQEPQRLPGGNVSPVYRVGDTVRRSTGPWTPAVHALLQHLERVGFAHAPRVLGLDDDGREILTYVEGWVPYAPDIPAAIWTDDALAAVARIVRSYHDAVATFVPQPDSQWRVCPGAPTSGEIVCHNDLGPWNLVYRDTEPVAFIDWDFAAPAPRVWDVAYACWRFVPLRFDGIPGDPGEPDVDECARRLRLFCDEYSLNDRAALMDAIEHRMQVMFDTVRVWGEAGVPGFAEMLQSGHAELPLKDQAFVHSRRDVFEAAL